MEISASVVNPPGSEALVAALRPFPLLVVAEKQYGPGVRTEDNGTLVADIVACAADEPDNEAVARHFGTTADHVRQALAYHAANGE